MDYTQLLRSQQTFFASHKTKDIAFRKAQLRQLKSTLIAYESKLYEAIAIDFGKSAFETFLTELALVYRELDFFIKNLDRISRPKKVRTGLSLQPGKSYIYNDPLGVVLIIGAWNYPYYLTLSPLINAIAAGNTCILKPSELAKQSSHILSKLIGSHFPTEYIAVVEGGVPETTALLELRVDKIFFTGSPAVGKIVYKAAARNLIPVTLELGGKSPAMVTESADLGMAAKRLVWGKFLNAGQTCIAPDYLLVAESVKSQLLELINAQLDKIRYEQGSNHYVRMINQKHFERVLALLDPEKITYGGQFDPATRHIAPTVMDQVTYQDPIMQEEIFGPILPVLSYQHFDEALHQLNTKEKPLAAYLFTKDKNEEKQFLNTVTFGGGCINDVIMHVSSERMPFGGVGNSGIGNYHGVFGFQTFSHQKSILKKSLWGEPNWKYPPYTAKKMKWIKRFI